jgi:hypothetical protein
MLLERAASLFTISKEQKEGGFYGFRKEKNHKAIALLWGVGFSGGIKAYGRRSIQS